MSQNVHAEPERMSTKQAVAAGTSIGAAVIMTTIGVLQFFQGIAAVAEDEVIVQGQEYTFKLDLTTWGWIHIVMGVVVVVVGIAGSARAIPSLGLLYLAVLWLGPRIGGDLAFYIPNMIVLIVLAIPPILSGTYAGIAGVDPAARDAARGMGLRGT